jgi:hypothetical protein
MAQNEPPHPRKLDSRPQPLAFVANVGQANAKVRLLARGLGGMLFFTDDEVVLAISNDRRRGNNGSRSTN